MGGEMSVCHRSSWIAAQVAWGLSLLAGCSGVAVDEVDAAAMDAAATDAATDGGAACRGAADCNDGLFCNGAEACVDGACQPGEPPALDDGVDCTADSCDEDADEIRHEANDALCAHLDAAPTCDGRTAVTTVGRCLASGCEAVEAREDCDAVDGLPRCTGTAEGGDLTHLASGGCVDGECIRLGRECDAGGPVCADGALTTHAPICDATSGCDEVSTTETCSAPAARCLGPVHVTYTPACADESSCGAAVESMETCSAPPPACVSNVYTVYAPTCDAAGGCGSAPAAETRCTDMEPPPTCAGGGISSTTCTCSVASAGCNCTTRVTSCPVSSTGRCVDSDTLEYDWYVCDDSSGTATCVSMPERTTCEHGCCPGSIFPVSIPTRCCPAPAGG